MLVGIPGVALLIAVIMLCGRHGVSRAGCRRCHELWLPTG